MTMIKTNINRLVELIGNGYSEKKNIELKKGDYEIEFEDYWHCGGKDILLYSSIQRITLPDMSFYPQIKSLYGVPAGVLHVRNNKVVASAEKKARKANRDSRHIMFRRAFLYATAWYTKSLPDFDDEYLYVIKDVLNSFLNHKDGFSVTILNELLSSNYFPEEQPKKVSLSNTHYEFSCLWLAKKIGAFFFNGNKMPDNCREWFIALRDNPTQLPFQTPAPLQDNAVFIMAYVLVLKAIEEENVSVENLKNLASEFCDGYRRQQIVYTSLLLWGLYHSAADHYYFANIAKPMMTALEKAAFLLSTNCNMDLSSDWDIAFHSLRTIDPKANCVNYYQTKFPSLRGRSWYDFSVERKPKADDELVLLPSNLANEFLSVNRRFFDIEAKTSSSVFLVDEAHKAEFEKYKFSYICKKLNGKDDIVLRNFSSKEKLEVVTLSDLKPNQTLFPFPMDYRVCPIVNPACKVWMIQLSEKKGFNSFVQSLLEQAYSFAKPELILLVYHIDSPKQELLDSTVVEKQSSQTDNQIAVLQRKMELLFPSSKVSILSHDDEQVIWESVTFGEKILEQYNFSDISILEFRSKKSRKEPASFVLRMIRDVLVYDEHLKYLFMNLG